MVWVEVDKKHRALAAINVLNEAGAHSSSAHTVTRYWYFDERPLEFFNPQLFQDRADFRGY